LNQKGVFYEFSKNVIKIKNFTGRLLPIVIFNNFGADKFIQYEHDGPGQTNGLSIHIKYLVNLPVS
jgi:hypothetical protein